ncbi:MAG: hypothetical protein ACOZCO_12810 [Bacteroidota bacterium]
MAKVPSAAVFDLIKSLNKTEIRYFRVYCNRHVINEKNKYLSLFDLVIKQESFNDNYLFLKSGFSRKQTYNELKRYLYFVILDALCAFYKRSTTTNSIKYLIEQTTILFEKQLFHQAYQLLQKAKYLAEKNESLKELYDVIELEETILLNHLHLHELDERLKNNFKRKRFLSNQIAVCARYRYYYLKMGVAYLKGISKGAQQIIHGLAGKIDIKEMHRMKQYEIYFHGFSVLEKDFELSGNLNQCIKTRLTLLKLIEKYLPLRNVYPDYFETYHNYILALIQAKHFKLVEKHLALLLAHYYKIKNEPVKTNVISYWFALTTKYFLQRRWYNELSNVAAKYDREIPVKFLKEDSYYNQWLRQKYWFAYAAFHDGNLRLCIRRLHEITNDPREGIGAHIQLYASLLKIIVHIEMGDFELGLSLLNALKRNFKVNNPRMNNVIRTYFSHIPKLGKSRLKQSWINFYHDLEKCKSKNNSGFPKELDITDWLKRKE